MRTCSDMFPLKTVLWRATISVRATFTMHRVFIGPWLTSEFPLCLVYDASPASSIISRDTFVKHSIDVMQSGGNLFVTDRISYTSHFVEIISSLLQVEQFGEPKIPSLSKFTCIFLYFSTKSHSQIQNHYALWVIFAQRRAIQEEPIVHLQLSWL